MIELKLTILLACASCCLSAAFVPSQPVYTIFRSQDELGGYHFGYSGGPTSRAERRDHEGVVRGAYNFVDDAGTVQKFEYISDALGYRLLSGTHLPVAPVAPVVEVAPVAPVFSAVDIPQPVEETAAVKAARAKFEAEFKKAADAAAAAPDPLN